MPAALDERPQRIGDAWRAIESERTANYTTLYRNVIVYEKVRYAAIRRHLPCRDTKGPHVACFRKAAALDRFRGHPAKRHLLSLNRAVRRTVLVNREPKVADLYLRRRRVGGIIRKNEHVAGSEVSVHD